MIQALIFINAYMAIIGILIIFLAKIFSQYGPCKIVINDDKEFIEDGGFHKSNIKFLIYVIKRNVFAKDS